MRKKIKTKKPSFYDENNESKKKIVVEKVCFMLVTSINNFKRMTRQKTEASTDWRTKQCRQRIKFVE
jgi:hypothetical protein